MSDRTVPTATEAPLPIIEGIAIMGIRDSSDEDSEVRGRARTRDNVQRSQYRSLSPRNRPDEAKDYEEEEEEQDGNEHIARVRLSTVLDMVVGADISDWFSAIEALQEQERSGELTDPPSLCVLNLLKSWTDLRIDTILTASNRYGRIRERTTGIEPEPESKYTETIFNKELRAYLKVYTGELGGKFIYNKNGDKKYLSADQKEKTVIKNVDATIVKDFNPKLSTH